MKFRFFATTLFSVLLIFAASALADLVVDSKTDIDVIGMGKMTMEGYQCFKGDRSYTKMKSSNMTGMSQESVEIVRLDKAVQWVLFPAQSKYAEITFDKVKEMSHQMDTAQVQSGGYTWKTSYNESAGSDTVAGIKCREVEGNAVGVKDGDPTDTVFIEFKQWLAGNFKGADELQTFRDNYKESTGLSDQLFSQLKGNPMMAQYGQPMQELGEKMKAEEGTPLKTMFSIKVSKNPMGASMGGQTGDNVLLSIVNVITEIKQEPVADSLFQIPTGFEKTDVSSMMKP